MLVLCLTTYEIKTATSTGANAESVYDSPYISSANTQWEKGPNHPPVKAGHHDDLRLKLCICDQGKSETNSSWISYQTYITFEADPVEPALCVIGHLNEYVKRTTTQTRL